MRTVKILIRLGGCSDWADAQADLSLRWAQMPFCWFCHEAAQFEFCVIGVKLVFMPLLHLPCFDDPESLL